VVSAQPFCIEDPGSILISHSTQAMYQLKIIIIFIFKNCIIGQRDEDTSKTLQNYLPQVKEKNNE
jgi:hypothetical protein